MTESKYVKFRRGSLSNFNVQQADEDTLYFLYADDDSADLYLGARKISSSEGGSSSVAQAIQDLTDVLVTDLQDKDILSYDSESQKWVNTSLNALLNELNSGIVKVIINDDNNDHDALIIQELETEQLIPRVGDIIIIKDSLENTNEYLHTGYVYDGTQWIAMQGNYNANTIYFTDDFIVTEDIGAIKISSNGSAEIPAKGKNLQELLTSIFAKEQNPEVVYPTAKISVSGGSGEVGTIYSTPTATLTVTDGSYSYGSKNKDTKEVFDKEDTGIIFEAGNVVLKQSDTENQVTNTSDFTNNSLTLTADNLLTRFTDEPITYNFSGEATYTTSNQIPLTNVGNYADISYQIGYNEIDSAVQDNVTITATGTTKAVFTGWRKMFVGSISDYDSNLHTSVQTPLTSEIIRGLDIGVQVTTNAQTFTVPVGATRIIVACPKTHYLSKCEYFTMNWETIDTFEQIDDVAVADATGIDGKIDYNVYVFSHANPMGFEANTDYRITLSK